LPIEAEAAKVRIAELKKARPRDEPALEAAEAEFKELMKAAREAKAKAEAIENAVYDLKAVNPNRKSNDDKRTPGELFDLIESKGKEIAKVLTELRKQRSEA